MGDDESGHWSKGEGNGKGKSGDLRAQPPLRTVYGHKPLSGPSFQSPNCCHIVEPYPLGPGYMQQNAMLTEDRPSYNYDQPSDLLYASRMQSMLLSGVVKLAQPQASGSPPPVESDDQPDRATQSNDMLQSGIYGPYTRPTPLNQHYTASEDTTSHIGRPGKRPPSSPGPLPNYNTPTAFQPCISANPGTPTIEHPYLPPGTLVYLPLISVLPNSSTNSQRPLPYSPYVVLQPPSLKYAPHAPMVNTPDVAKSSTNQPYLKFPSQNQPPWPPEFQQRPLTERQKASAGHGGPMSRDWGPNVASPKFQDVSISRGPMAQRSPESLVLQPQPKAATLDNALVEKHCVACNRTAPSLSNAHQDGKGATAGASCIDGV